MIQRMLIATLAVVVFGTVAVAGGNSMWLHVYVNEGGPGGEKVRLNLPLQLVEAVLPLIDEDEFSNGRIQIDDMDFSADDLREIWNAVRDEEDGVYIQVEEMDEEVTVAREKDHIVIHVVEAWDDEEVEVKLPVTVIDALLAGDGEELDILAAIRAFGKQGGGDLVMVSEDDSVVRVWVDDKSSGRSDDS